MWGQGFINAPKIVQTCLLTWKKHNPTWHIIELDNSNLSQYIDLKPELPENILYDWNGTVLPIPNNYETKLINRYGKDWQTPQNSKGPQPPKTTI